MKNENKTKAQLIKELQKLRQQLSDLKAPSIQTTNKREEKFHIFLDAIFEAVFISENGICLEQNSIAEDMFGYSNDEAIGKPGTEWIAPEHRKLVKQNILNEHEKSYEIIAQRKDGSTFPCEIRVKMIEYKGRKLRVNALRDISEKKKAEDLLRVSEKKYRTIADFTYDWEYWINPENNFIYISPSVERITGYSLDNFYNDKFLMEKIIHPDNQSIYNNHQHEIMDDDIINPIEFRIITKKGAERWISHVCQNVYREDGKLLGLRGSNRDITERKKAEQTLKESETRLKTIVENMPVMLDSFDEKGNIVVWNKECEHVTGYNAEGL
ncbi:MAG: PAS domain S-box protein [Calditrichia bacterium]|nr:PAS domain S-box protein [Calditrichia bacterium]